MMEIKSEEELLTSAAMGGGGVSNSSSSGPSESTPNTHHILVCALTAIGSLLKSLGTEAIVLLTDGSGGGNASGNATASKSSTSVVDSICATLLHPSSSVRLVAAWCMRSLAVALPSQRTPFILKCAEQLDALRYCCILWTFCAILILKSLKRNSLTINNCFTVAICSF